MARMYRNFLNGTTTNNPLLIGGTTITSANVAALPEVVAPDLLVLVLDPDASAGAPEIVYVSAHTVASTSATIIRGQEGTVAREHASGTVWRHAATTEDFERLDDIDTSIASLQAADTSLDGRLDAIEANDWVTSARIATDAVGSAEIAAAAVTATELASDAVTTAKILDGAVTSAKIADGTIVAGDLASDAVTTAKILDGAVTSAKIADGTIVSGDLADSAVTSAKINDSAVTTAKINDGAVTSAKIADGTIATADIADSAVTSAKIADGTIVSGDIANAAVTNAKASFTATSYTPAVYSSGIPGEVSVGSGSNAYKEGRYMVLGKMMWIHIAVGFGTGASAGASGYFTFDLPGGYTAANTREQVMTGKFYNSSGTVDAVALIFKNTTSFYIYPDSTPLGPASHGSFGDGYNILLEGVIELA